MWFLGCDVCSGSSWSNFGAVKSKSHSSAAKQRALSSGRTPEFTQSCKKGGWRESQAKAKWKAAALGPSAATSPGRGPGASHGEPQRSLCSCSPFPPPHRSPLLLPYSPEVALNETAASSDPPIVAKFTKWRSAMCCFIGMVRCPMSLKSSFENREGGRGALAQCSATFKKLFVSRCMHQCVYRCIHTCTYTCIFIHVDVEMHKLPKVNRFYSKKKLK